MSGKGAGAGLPVDVRYSVVGPLAGVSGRGAVASAVPDLGDDLGAVDAPGC
jgi:hypothetical protein